MSEISDEFEFSTTANYWDNDDNSTITFNDTALLLQDYNTVSRSFTFIITLQISNFVIIKLFPTSFRPKL